MYTYTYMYQVMQNFYHQQYRSHKKKGPLGAPVWAECGSYPPLDYLPVSDFFYSIWYIERVVYFGIECMVYGYMVYLVTPKSM